MDMVAAERARAGGDRVVMDRLPGDRSPPFAPVAPLKTHPIRAHIARHGAQEGCPMTNEERDIITQFIARVGGAQAAQPSFSGSVPAPRRRRCRLSIRRG